MRKRGYLQMNDKRFSGISISLKYCSGPRQCYCNSSRDLRGVPTDLSAIPKKACEVMLMGILLYLSIPSLAQNKANDTAPLVIISDVNRKEIHPGDTVCFTVKNKTVKDRGYTIEVITSGSQHLKIGYDAIYTAYFNSDSSFLKGKERKKGTLVQFRIIPDLIDDEPEALILSKPFFLFAEPF